MNEETKPAKKRGAPSKKTAEICDRICEGIALGKSARSMCEEVGITQKTFWKWLDEDEHLVKQYARAKERCADFIAEEIIEISDDAQNDYLVREDGSRYVDNEAVQRSRLRVDARKWYAGKLAPKKYGEKIVNEHQGGDPDRPILKNISVSFVASNPQK